MRTTVLLAAFATAISACAPTPDPGYGDYPLPPERLAELYANDVDAAKQLMIDAGFEDGFEVELQAIAAPRSCSRTPMPRP